MTEKAYYGQFVFQRQFPMMMNREEPITITAFINPNQHSSIAAFIIRHRRGFSEIRALTRDADANFPSRSRFGGGIYGVGRVSDSESEYGLDSLQWLEKAANDRRLQCDAFWDRSIYLHGTPLVLSNLNDLAESERNLEKEFKTLPGNKLMTGNAELDATLVELMRAEMHGNPRTPESYKTLIEIDQALAALHKTALISKKSWLNRLVPVLSGSSRSRA